MSEQEAVIGEHGVEFACYSNGPEGYLPHIGCLCGFETSRACINWEEVGAEFDHHLKSVEAQRSVVG